MGMRGRWAVPLVSMWRVPPKPPRKRRCRRCGRLFKPVRHDAVYCGTRCRVAIYRKRRVDDQTVDDRPVFLITLRAEPGIDGARALKGLLKFGLRKFGLRTLRQEQSGDAA